MTTQNVVYSSLSKLNIGLEERAQRSKGQNCHQCPDLVNMWRVFVGVDVRANCLFGANVVNHALLTHLQDALPFESYPAYFVFSGWETDRSVCDGILKNIYIKNSMAHITWTVCFSQYVNGSGKCIVVMHC